MKLATLKDGTRDGQLVVVSSDLKRCVADGRSAGTMRELLDDWDDHAESLEETSQRLDLGQVEGEIFDPAKCMAPLPRTTLWADGSAYINHVELARKARGAEMPESFLVEPLMYIGAGDALLGPMDDILCTSEDWGIDMEAEVAVVTGDVPMGSTPDEAATQIKLVMLANDISFRYLIPDELAKGFGFMQSKGPTAFSPVAVTPDELGDRWKDGKLHGAMLVEHNGSLLGRADTGVDMMFNFPQLIAHAAKTRAVCSGAIIGSGTVSNKNTDGSPGTRVADGGKGYSCIVEIRIIEKINDAETRTDFMHFGDTVRIEMKNEDGVSIFGAIEQEVVKDG